MRTRYIPFRVYRRLGGMTPHITPQNEEYTEKKSHNPSVYEMVIQKCMIMQQKKKVLSIRF